LKTNNVKGEQRGGKAHRGRQEEQTMDKHEKRRQETNTRRERGEY
jgi:hypothetical protein